MVSNVLLEILFKSYACGELSLASETTKDGSSNHLRKIHANPAKEGITSQKFSYQFLENIRVCITEILVTLTGRKIDLVRAFWEPFLNVCLDAISTEAEQQESGKSFGCINRISEFLFHLGKSWPLIDAQKSCLMAHAVRPLVEKLFPIVKSMVWKA